MRTMPILLNLLLIIFISSCSSEEKLSVEKYINALPKEEKEDSLSAYAEYSLFSEIEKAYNITNNIESFSKSLRFFERFPESEYEIEIYDILTKTIPRILTTSNNYFVVKAKDNHKTNIHGTNVNKYVENFLSDFGIEKEGGTYKYNYVHYKKIAYYKGFSALKDAAYYTYLKKTDLLPFEEGEKNADKLYTNILLLDDFADMFPSSMLIEEIYENNKYFPKDQNTASLGKYTLSKYRSKKRSIKRAIEKIKPEENTLAFVDGNRVRMREKIPSLRVEENLRNNLKDVYELYDYNIVHILKNKRRYVRYKRSYEKWAFIKVKTENGFISGWSFKDYIIPVTNITDDFKMIDKFHKAWLLKEKKEYIKSANAFSDFILSYPETYLTDKAYYLLWELNGIIGAMATTADNDFSKYVLTHIRYFVHDKNENMLRCSNLIYEMLSLKMPQSGYLYKVDNKFILE